MLHVFNRITDLGGQLRLKLEHNADFSRDRFIVSAPNREAAETLDAWPNQRGGALALIGSPGAGKTHLAAAWAERTGAEVITLADLAEDELGDLSGPMLLDGADAAPTARPFSISSTRRSSRKAACSSPAAPRREPGAWMCRTSARA